MKRTFESGATRGTAQGKIDLEGAFSVLSFERYGQYMLEHTVDSAGERRESDNWQKGFPLHSYVKSLLRHLLTLWKVNRGFWDPEPKFVEDTLCAIIFNAQGYLHVYLKKQLEANSSDSCVPDDPLPADAFTSGTAVDSDGRPLDVRSVSAMRRDCLHRYVSRHLACCGLHCFECADHDSKFEGV